MVKQHECGAYRALIRQRHKMTYPAHMARLTPPQTSNSVNIFINSPSILSEVTLIKNNINPLKFTPENNKCTVRNTVS